MIFLAIFGCKRVNYDEMDGDRLRLPANRNCYRLLRILWALLKFLVLFSVNRISTLKEFQYCLALKDLYLRKNCIQDLAELAYLQELPNLRVLWLSENPCAYLPDYRNTVLRYLPNLLKLDNIGWRFLFVCFIMLYLYLSCKSIMYIVTRVLFRNTQMGLEIFLL